MNKKKNSMFVCLLVILYTLAIIFGVGKNNGYPHNYVIPFTFLSILFTLVFFLIIIKELLQKKNPATNGMNYTKLFSNYVTSSFFLVVNSILIEATIFLSINGYDYMFLLISPSYAGFNMLWVYVEYKSVRNEQKFSLISNIPDEIKKDPTNLIFSVIDVILIVSTILAMMSIINSLALTVLIPLLVLFKIVWIAVNIMRKKGMERDRLNLRVLLVLFGFCLFWNLVGSVTIFEWIFFLPFTIICMIYIIIQLNFIKNIDKDTSNNLSEDLIDEHIDILKKLNGKIQEQR